MPPAVILGVDAAWGGQRLEGTASSMGSRRRVQFYLADGVRLACEAMEAHGFASTSSSSVLPPTTGAVGAIARATASVRSSRIFSQRQFIL